MKFLLSLLAGCFLFNYANACDVYAYEDLLACIDSNTTINLKTNIILYPNQNINIDGINNLVINGLNGTIKHSIDESNDRFISQTYNNPHYISITNSSNIRIENIVFKSSAASDLQCAHDNTRITRYNTPPCLGDVAAKNSTNIQIYSNEFTSQKTFQAQIFDVNGLYIENNTFKNASTFGLWMNGETSNGLQNFRVITNNFQLSGANAIILAGVANGWIGNNNFLNNHRLTQYSGYGGGQLLFEDSLINTSDVSVTGNLITSTSDKPTHGMEFANFDRGGSLLNIEVIWNRIVGNKQSAVKFDDSNTNSRLTGVKIYNNEFIENSSPYKSQTITKSFGGFEIFNNTIQKNGKLISASFLNTAQSCTLINGQDRCNITIKWSATNGINPYITVRSNTQQVGNKNRGLFSTGILNGSQDAAWIDRTGAIFELYDKADYEKTNGWEAPIASIIVKAKN
jgi:hypothetical protein